MAKTEPNTTRVYCCNWTRPTSNKRRSSATLLHTASENTQGLWGSTRDFKPVRFFPSSGHCTLSKHKNTRLDSNSRHWFVPKIAPCIRSAPGMFSPKIFALFCKRDLSQAFAVVFGSKVNELFLQILSWRLLCAGAGFVDTSRLFFGDSYFRCSESKFSENCNQVCTVQQLGCNQRFTACLSTWPVHQKQWPFCRVSWCFSSGRRVQIVVYIWAEHNFPLRNRPLVSG